MKHRPLFHWSNQYTYYVAYLPLTVLIINSKPSEHIFLAAYEYGFPYGSNSWFIESGCTTHIICDLSLFTSYSATKISDDLGADSSSGIVEEGDVFIQVRVNGKVLKCAIKNAKHAPIPLYQLNSVNTRRSLGSGHRLMKKALSSLANKLGTSLLRPP